MSDCKANISKNSDGSFYALVVLVDDEGQENVLRFYKGRNFKTEKAAERSCNKYIAKHDL